MKNLENFPQVRPEGEPPLEILRPNEIIKPVEANQFKEVLAKAEVNKKPGWFKNFLNRWTQRGLIFLTLATSPNISDALLEGSLAEHGFDKGKNKVEQFDNKAEETSTIPEIVIYGHRDDRTDAIVNYLSGKDPLPESMKEEMTVRMFICRAMEIEPHFNAEGTMDLSDPYNKFVSEAQGRILSLDESNFSQYLAEKKYVEDMVDYEMMILPQGYTQTNPFQGKTYEDKLNYLKSFEASLMGSKGAGDVYRKMSKEDFENVIINKQTDFMRLNKLFYKSGDFSVEKYNTVWTMHLSHGNPKVDFSHEFGSEMSGGKRAYYNMAKNKMYLGVEATNNEKLDVTVTLEDWLAELSHSEQNEKQKISPEKRWKIDSLAIVSHLLSKGEFKEQEKMGEQDFLYYSSEGAYNIEGTTEYEAHKQIEPKLKQELEKGLQ